MKKILIIDGYSLFFRAFYATSYSDNYMHTSKGIPTNAIYTFTNMLFKILETCIFTHIVVALDTKGKTFRHDIFPEYKGHRKPAPLELKEQFCLLIELLDSFNINYVSKANYEADDIIGTICKKSEDHYNIDIYTGDKDLLQLITDKINIIILTKGITNTTCFNKTKFMEEYTFEPKYFIDYKSLIGDKSDNIPGVDGIGEKTAKKLISQYKKLGNLYTNIDELSKVQKQRLIQGKESAFLSKKLSCIDQNVDININIDDFYYSNFDYLKAEEFFRKIEAKSLIKKLQCINYKQQNINTKDKDNEFLEAFKDEVNYENDINLIDENEELTFSNKCLLYFEMPFNNYHDQSPFYVVILDRDNKYIFKWENFINNKSVLKWLKDNHKHKVVIDSKSIYYLFLKNKIIIEGIIFDIFLATYILSPTTIINELADVAMFLNFKLNYNEVIYGKKINNKVNIDENDIFKYLYEKNLILWNIYNSLNSILKKENLLKILEDIDLPISMILAKMEYTGIKVNKKQLIQQGEMLILEIKKIKEKIYSFTDCVFNISSTQQLSDILYNKLALPTLKKTKTTYSTSIETLNHLSIYHPIVKYIIKYRKLTKIYNTYIKGLIPLIKEDKRIHTVYKQTQTATGRLSSADPNLQNIPIKHDEGKNIRKAFIADENHYLVSFDYSQIEIRILAELSKNDYLINIFKNKRDIHSETAQKLFNLNNLDEVTEEMRSQAKTVNFGIIYGISSYGLAQQLKTSNDYAEKFINKYFETFPQIKEYMDSLLIFAKDNGYTQTITGRRRYFPDIKSKNYHLRNLAKRAAMNMPIQGTASDIIKLAMINIENKIQNKNIKAKLLLQIHDELIFSIYKEHINYIDLIKKEMENVLNLNVPLQVNYKKGYSWFEIK